MQPKPKDPIDTVGLEIVVIIITYQLWVPQVSTIGMYCLWCRQPLYGWSLMTLRQSSSLYPTHMLDKDYCHIGTVIKDCPCTIAVRKGRKKKRQR